MSGLFNSLAFNTDAFNTESATPPSPRPGVGLIMEAPVMTLSLDMGESLGISLLMND